MKNLRAVLFTLLIVGVGCTKDEITTNKNQVRFDYSTSGSVQIEVSAPTALAGASFDLYTANPDSGGQLLTRAALNSQGVYQNELMLSSDISRVWLESRYIGMPGDLFIPILNGRAYFEVSESTGPNKPFVGPIEFDPLPGARNSNTHFGYMGTFNSQGVPSYLTVSDNVDQSLLSDVNAALPENAPVPTAHPQYLAVGNSVDLNLQDSADVWVTFVHEGAGYRNVLGYYVYETANPPATKDDIDSIRMIFPNVSYQGSGGGLTSGNKVYLGSYGASKSIGWVFPQNAWNGNSVNTSAQKFYSEPSFNPEPSASQRQHVIQL